MKRIGILTYWGVPNYGAWVQAYALNRLLTDMYPEYEVKHIAYLEQSHWDSYYKNDEKGLNNFLYNWDLIPHVSFDSIEEMENAEFDVLITAADSIWEEAVNGVFNHDWHLIGKGFKKGKKIISYAPSAGTYADVKEINHEIIAGLKKYNAISVRDESTQRFVKRVIGIKPELVVDPALLWNFKSDLNIKKPVYRDYIAVYGAQWSPEFISNVKALAKEKNLKLISIGFINDWCDVNFRRNELRTLEWIGMIANSDIVVTSTFHGLMLGISYRKQIKFCQVNYVKNRSNTLIEDLRISNANISFGASIDYDNYADEKLKRLREKSLIFIKGALYR